MSTKAVLAAGNTARVAVGKVVFLHEEDHDLYFLGRIAEVTVRHEDDSSLVLVIFCRERMSAVWLADLKVIVPFFGRFEIHKVAETQLTKSGRLVRMVTHRCRCLQNQPRLLKLLGSTSAIFMTTRAARVFKLQ